MWPDGLAAPHWHQVYPHDNESTAITVLPSSYRSHGSPASLDEPSDATTPATTAAAVEHVVNEDDEEEEEEEEEEE